MTKSCFNPLCFSALSTLALVLLTAGCSKCEGDDTCLELEEIAKQHRLALAVVAPASSACPFSEGDDAPAPGTGQAGSSGIEDEEAPITEDGEPEESCEEALFRHETRLAQYYDAHSAALSWQPEDGCPTAEQMQAIHDLASEESVWFEETKKSDGEKCCYKSGAYCD